MVFIEEFSDPALVQGASIPPKLPGFGAEPEGSLDEVNWDFITPGRFYSATLRDGTTVEGKVISRVRDRAMFELQGGRTKEIAQHQLADLAEKSPPRRRA